MDEQNITVPEPAEGLPEAMRLDGSPAASAFETVQEEAAISQQRQAGQADEERLRLALEAGQLGSWDYEVIHNTLFYDERCRSILGIGSAGSLNAQQASELIHPDDLNQIIYLFYEAIDPASSGRFDIETRIARPDGLVRWIMAKGQILFEGKDNQRQAVRLVGVIEDITERKQVEAERERLLQELQAERAQLKALTETLEAQVEGRTEQVRALGAALTLAEQQERSRISQVLHDDLQQLLYGLLMRLNILNRDIPASDLPVLAEQIDPMTQAVDQAINITRNLVSDLNPPLVKMEDMGEALEWLAMRTEAMYQLKVQLSVQERFKVSIEAQTLLLQMVRELLFNAVKHAKASQVSVGLRQESHAVIVQVADDGQGFDVTAFQTEQRQDGFGLFNIQERLALIGGRLEIDSFPGQGTRIAITIPVQ